MKIVDCFSFFCEIKMLKFRLEELYDYVDHFVITEANKTHSNQDKPWNFLENKSEFEKYIDKIVYVQVEDMPNDKDAWVREKWQRNCIIRGLNRLNLNPDDIILVSDLDEIPDTETLEILKKEGLGNEIYQIGQDMYFYNLTVKDPNIWDLGTKYLKYSNINFPISYLRNTNFTPLNYKGGWHFSYFGDSKFISYKIQSFAHQEYNHQFFTDVNMIENRIKKGSHIYERNDVAKWFHLPLEHNTYLPKNWKMLL